jgi:hypothetical protein
MTKSKMTGSDESPEHFPNMILIAGAGRNTGKTSFACALIKKFSQDHRVTALKFSPHMHEGQNTDHIIFQTEEFIILKEQALSKKDSSLMLQAGASEVFFIQGDRSRIQEAFDHIKSHLTDGPVICESGGLHEYVEPGLFFFLKKGGSVTEGKQSALIYNPIILGSFDEADQFVDKIRFESNKFLFDV